MKLIYHPSCAGYGSEWHPECRERVVATEKLLCEREPDWQWQAPQPPELSDVLRAHTAAHIERVREPVDFDADTPAYPGIFDHALLSAGAAMEVGVAALAGVRAISLMRPPGHHACTDRAMGFCYFNNVVVAALAALEKGASKIVIWDFDAHHGNGTEEICAGREDIVYVSVHQYPGYPGTGTTSYGNLHNFPVRPGSSSAEHMAVLKKSWEAVLASDADLLLVSAGFDAYYRDPITDMSLEKEDFATLGGWLSAAPMATGAVLEGGYSEDLPGLIHAFLKAWDHG